MIHLTSLYKSIKDGTNSTIDILQDITLDFPMKGLIVITGESGSGKTTLLNMMSGLDRPSSGVIEVLDEVFERYHPSRWDRLRRESIGIVFQDFNIIEEYTVYENLEIVVRLNGVISLEEMQKQIDSVLSIVGMKTYADRKCSALSGGQKQRVAIARSLVMNPTILFADEPTGNLDRKTTIQIMNVFNQIAKNRLVIVVTHEKDIAKLYASRIITLQDGVIVSDEMNDSSTQEKLKQEQIIYLDELKKESLRVRNHDITYYYNENEKEELFELDIIEKNQTLYIKTYKNDAIRIKALDQYSDISIKETNDESMQDQELPQLINLSSTSNHLVRIKDAFRFAKRKINSIRYGGTMLYVALGLIGALIAVSIGILGEIWSVDDDDFIQSSRQYITVIADEITLDEALELNQLDSIEYVQLVEEPMEFLLVTKPYYEVRNPIRIKAHPNTIELLEEDDIIYGSYPENTYDIVLDQFIADEIIKNHQNRGMESYKDIIHSEIQLYTNSLPGDYDQSSAITFKIVGVSNDDSPTIYMDHSLTMSFALTNIVDYRVFEDGFEIVTGELPTENKQLLLHETSSLIRNGNIPSFVGIESGYYEVVGTYRYVKNGVYMNTSDIMISTIDVMHDAYFRQRNYDVSSTSFLVYASDRSKVIQELNEEGYVAKSNYLEDFNDYTAFEFQTSLGLFIFAVAAIISSMISTIFILRSSLTARRYELSIYRALGASKNNIRMLFAAEIVIITIISSIIGYGITVIMLLLIQQQIIQYVEILYYSIPSIIFGVGLVFTINIVFGLIPLQQMIQETPATNLRHYDL